jgi:hypothetical protein
MKTPKADSPAQKPLLTPAAQVGAHTQAAPGVQAFPPSPDQQQGMALQAMVNQSPVVQRAARQQAQVDAGIGGKGVVQRIIHTGRKVYPSTYRQVEKTKEYMIDFRDDAMKKAKKILGITKRNVKLEEIWGKIAKDKKKKFDITLPNEFNALVQELVIRYGRSMKAQQSYRQRTGQSDTLGGRVTALDKRLKFTKSARNPMVEHKHPEEVTLDDQPISKEERFATHVATMGMHLHPEGQEFQASTSKDGSQIRISSNLNAVNEQLALQKWQMAWHLKKSAKKLLEQLGVDQMSKKKAMNNRLIRHLAKLFWRIEDYLEQDAPISFPAKVAKELDGMHAEIRITSEATWNKNDFHAPQGTKYPCLGCFIYMNGKKIEVGHFHGPLWVTNSAMTTQMREALLLGHSVGHLSGKELAKVGDRLAHGYQHRPKGSKFVRGKKRDGTSGYDVNADSDSELEDDEFTTLKSQLGKPLEWRQEEEEDSDDDL